MIEWREPKRLRKENIKIPHTNIVKALKRKPEKWAVIFTFPIKYKSNAYVLASDIRHSNISYYADGIYEATAQQTLDKESIEVFARYISPRT